MVEAYNTGVVFDKTDIERFINTNLKGMWNGDTANPKFANSNWRPPMPPGPDGKPLPRRRPPRAANCGRACAQRIGHWKTAMTPITEMASCTAVEWT
jgi:hypothetical protein